MEKISTGKAPEAIGPYSQAILSGGFVFTAGQIGISPITNALAEGGVAEQARQALENIKSVLESGGTSLSKVVKVTVYLRNMDDFQKMNEVYAEYFTNRPARSTVGVSGLPKNALIEIDVIAECG